MKVALVYDRVNKWGGAERVLLALHKLFPQAPLYTSVYDRKKAPWASAFDIKTSFLQNLPFAIHHELFAVFMPLAFESFNFDEFDLVISVTSEAAKGIITKPKTLHICYCLTPTRYLWSGYNDYFRNPLFSFFAKPAVWYLRFWDKTAAQRPDAFIAISKEVKQRIKRYYGRNSKVIYPPLTINDNLSLEVSETSRQSRVADDTRLSSSKKNTGSCSLSERLFSGLTKQSSNEETAFSSSASGLPPRFSNSYFLIVSRLVSYKKVDLAIEVFNKLKLPLKIIGSGASENSLKKMAGPTIEFLGYLTNEELAEYYKGCRALVFPGLEDFGLTILEAQSFGKPVIAFRAGGALETIIDGKTGLFFDKQNVESLVTAIKQFNRLEFDPKDCVRQAEEFNFERFGKELMEVVNNLTI